MELRFAVGKGERPELDIAINVLDDSVEGNLRGQWQFGTDRSFEYQLALIVGARDPDRIDRAVPAVEAKVVEIVARPPR